MINKYSNVPLYLQLKNEILKKIDEGEYSENSKIPSEQELCGYYKISRPTVRQAISELTNSCVLYKLKGKGTFVSKSKLEINIRNYSGFTDSILDGMDLCERELVSVSVMDSLKIKALEVIFSMSSTYSQSLDFAEIKYISLKDGEALSFNTSYLSLTLFPDIIEDIKEGRPSHEILKGKYPLLPVNAKSSLEVEYTDQNNAQYLQLQPGQPLIKIESVLFSKNGNVVEYIISKYRGDKCKLVFENSKT